MHAEVCSAPVNRIGFRWHSKGVNPLSLGPTRADRTCPISTCLHPKCSRRVLSTASNEMREDLRLFAGRNAQAFLDAYGAGRTGWRGQCWAEFFLPQVWFLYRKLYGMAAFTVFWPIAWAFVHIPSSWGHGLSTGPRSSGLQGRSLYVTKAKKVITQIFVKARPAKRMQKRASRPRAGFRLRVRYSAPFSLPVASSP